MSVAHKPVQELVREDFELGAKGAIFSLTSGYVTLHTSQFVMERVGIPTVRPQSFLGFYDHFQKINNSLMRALVKSLTIFYLVILVPIVEEWIFRDWIYQMQKESGASQVYRVISNGILFGAFHFSIFFGWANLPIVAVATVIGIIFAILREMRLNSYASTIAHSINNAVVFLFLKFI